VRTFSILLVAILLSACGFEAGSAELVTTTDGPDTVATPQAPELDLARAPRRTFYVARSGSDRSAGTRRRPFATIQKGLRRARPGDEVVVRPGRYASARFVRSGTAAAPIRLTAHGKVVLRGGGSGDGIAVHGKRHIVISGFTVTRFSVGISLAGAHDVVVRGNVLRSNTSTGIMNWEVSRVLIIGNRLLDPGPPYPMQPEAVQDYGVNVYYSESVSITDNYFFGKHNQALSFKRHVLTSSATGNDFEGCMYTCIYVGQNDDDGEGDMTSRQITVRGNRFRPGRDPRTDVRYRVSIPIRVRNVRHALVERNVIHPACLDRIDVERSPQGSGLTAGDNTVRRNHVRAWA
jgi:hypothetical protein